jgi:hypothetical protein
LTSIFDGWSAAESARTLRASMELAPRMRKK